MNNKQTNPALHPYTLPEGVVLEAKDIVTTFYSDGQRAEAVTGSGLTLKQGEIIGLVGESGSGKSMAALAVMGLIPSPPGSVSGGSIRFRGRELVGMDEEERRRIRGKDIAMIHFKDFLRKDAGGQLAATGAGQGGMEDYRTILRFAKQEKPWVFATLENTTPENSVQCLQYLQKQYDAC